MNSLDHIRDIILSKKLIMWDFDGSFCETEQLHFQAYAWAFKQFGHIINEDEYYMTFTHLGGEVPLEIENHKLFHLKVDEIKALKRPYYRQMVIDGRAKIFEEVPGILRVLKNNNIKSAIVTNSPQEEIQIVLAQQQEKLEISYIVGMLPEYRKKPAPDLYLAALAQAQIPPEDVLVIEDSERGLKAAHAAGCQTLWIQTSISERFSTDEPYLAKLTHKKLLEILELTEESVKRSA